MSTEAQFYEARRRQTAIDRRHSLRTQQDIDKQNQKPKYQYLYIPVRFVDENEQKRRCTCISMPRMQVLRTAQSLFQRDRDIYP